VSFINSRTLHDRRRGAGVVMDGKEQVPLSERLIAEMTAGEIESVVSGALFAGPRASAPSGVSIDSRTIQAGELFFAIRGPHTDGHLHVGTALNAGALGAVVDGGFVPSPDFPADRVLIRVGDTHAALKELAAEVRRRWLGSLVAVTGSVGKTTTKEFIAHVLRSEYSVYRSHGNYNNLFGLPLSILQLGAADHIGVFEMGMSAAGEIAEMCRIARPHAGVLTAIAPVHLEFFSSIDDIARAKGELADALDERGTFVYNADDPRVRAIGEATRARVISFGTGADADVAAEEVEVAALDETRFTLRAFGETRRAMLPFAGLHYVMDALPAVALARHYRIPLEQIVESLGDLRSAPMRGQVMRFKEGFTLIDDSYNSNPRALLQMIETVAALRGPDRRILVGGEMRELGPESKRFHRESGQAAAQRGIDRVVAVGGDAAELARGARDAGMPDASVQFFADSDEAARHVRDLVRPGDLVLVKGSRGVHLERVVELLRGSFEEERG
jgi:UDP-N-acetylmuramoyl-tripeptide--D-alanyl-D-alanine ligase